MLAKLVIMLCVHMHKDVYSICMYAQIPILQTKKSPDILFVQFNMQKYLHYTVCKQACFYFMAIPTHNPLQGVYCLSIGVKAQGTMWTQMDA